MWSFEYTHNICGAWLQYDYVAVFLLFMTVASIIVICFGVWLNEYAIQCILYEESQYLNIEKYRYDWM